MLVNQEKQNKNSKGLVVAFDLDGVVFDGSQFVKKILNKKIILKLLKNKLNLENFSTENDIDKLYDIALDSPCGERAVNQIYKKRKPKKFMVELVKKLIKQENSIFFVTAFSDKKLAEERLKKNNIEGYHGLITRKKGESAVEFKINTIKELEAKVVIDNSKKIIDEVNNVLPEIKSVYYQETEERTEEQIAGEVREIVAELKLRNESTNELLNEVNKKELLGEKNRMMGRIR